MNNPALVDYMAKIVKGTATIEAMKAENKYREVCGESPAYNEVGFMEVAHEMEEISKAIGVLYSTT